MSRITRSVPGYVIGGSRLRNVLNNSDSNYGDWVKKNLTTDRCARKIEKADPYWNYEGYSGQGCKKSVKRGLSRARRREAKEAIKEGEEE